MGPLNALRKCPPEVLPPGALLVVACSGGRDSMALCHALRATGQWSLHVATVDHGLRPSAADDAAFVLAQARAWGLSATVLSPPGPGMERGPDAGPEDAARRRRHAALEAERVRVGGARVVYAHTADDQLETMLMRLAAGAGAAGLAGMAPLSGLRARPWLSIRRAEVAAYAGEAGVSFREDPTNGDDRFLRNRVRAVLLPAFEAVFGAAGVDGALRTSALARTQDAALAAGAESLPIEGPLHEGDAVEVRIDLGLFRSAHRALRRIAVHHWICALYDAAERPRPRRMFARVERVHSALERGEGRAVAGRDGFSFRQSGAVACLRLERLLP
jgi:tRNA(Ile)-lysidine synthetase-like protein